MVTKMENEMKQKNEEILAFWRNLGFLKGLKEGSINEWRCAKSFQNMADYLMENNINSYALTTLSFPLIRRVLCTGKKRLHRILNPSEINDFFLTSTPNECIEFCQYSPKSKKGKILKDIYKNFLKYEDCGGKSLMEFFDGMLNKTEEHYNVFQKIMDGIFDWEAEMLAISSELFVNKSEEVNKLGDILEVGDEFETDKGEKMIVTAKNDKGEITAKYK